MRDRRPVIREDRDDDIRMVRRSPRGSRVLVARACVRDDDMLFHAPVYAAQEPADRALVRDDDLVVHRATREWPAVDIESGK